MAFDLDTIRTRLREVAFLNSSATITYATGAPAAPAAANGNGTAGSGDESGNGAAAGGEGSGEVETFHFEGGIAEFVQWNNRTRTPMHDPVFVRRTVSRLRSRSPLPRPRPLKIMQLLRAGSSLGISTLGRLTANQGSQVTSR